MHHGHNLAAICRGILIYEVSKFDTLIFRYIETFDTMNNTVYSIKYLVGCLRRIWLG